MSLVLPVLFCTFTGWFVLWLAVKMLFWPHKPFTIAGFTIQGILPANQQLFAEKIGRLVRTEFFSFDTLAQQVTSPENFNKLKPEIETHIDHFLRVRLKETFPMLSMLIGDKTVNQLKTAFLTELESLFPVLMASYITNLQKDIDIEKQVTATIAGFSVSKAEHLIYQSAKKQWIKLQLMGAVMGMLVGLLLILLQTQLFT